MSWIEPPFNISAHERYFVCKVLGDSMNKIIPNGAYCLFKKDEGGSRNGKIVLVESTSINDLEFGSGYTVKEYQSMKVFSGEEWSHDTITLNPLSTIEGYQSLELNESDLINFKVVGIFDRLLI